MGSGNISMQRMNKSTAQEKSRYYIIFRIDRQFYALALDDVVRVIRMVAISPIPDMHDSMLGIINMAGQIIPVIDLRFLFGQPNKPPELQDILLVVQVQGQSEEGSQTSLLVLLPRRRQ